MHTERVEIVTQRALKYYLDNRYGKYKPSEIISHAIHYGTYDDIFIHIKYISSDEFIAYVKDTDWLTGRCSLTNIVDAFPHAIDEDNTCINIFVERIKLDPETKTEMCYTVLDVKCKDSDINDTNNIAKKEILRSAIHDIAPTITVGQIENIFTAIKEIYNIELK